MICASVRDIKLRCMGVMRELDKTLLPENSEQLLFSLPQIYHVPYYFLRREEKLGQKL